MLNFKFHFEYSKSQQNGIFVLVGLIVIFQIIIMCDFFGDHQAEIESSPITDLIEKRLDSLTNLNRKQQKSSFNPNYISDYKGYQLGMSLQEIDRLHAFREKGKYIKSVADFKKVTLVSDSLLKEISPFFKFPTFKKSTKKQFTTRAVIVVKDINTASVDDLSKVSGINYKTANTIVKYRALLKGYTFLEQLNEVWGLSNKALHHLKKEYKVLSKPNIRKINVNKASVKELSSIVYINYKQANSIVEYRNEFAEIQNLAELKTISNFPVDKFDLISLYLQAD